MIVLPKFLVLCMVSRCMFCNSLSDTFAVTSSNVANCSACNPPPSFFDEAPPVPPVWPSSKSLDCSVTRFDSTLASSAVSSNSVIGSTAALPQDGATSSASTPFAVLPQMSQADGYSLLAVYIVVAILGAILVVAFIGCVVVKCYNFTRNKSMKVDPKTGDFREKNFLHNFATKGILYRNNKHPELTDSDLKLNNTLVMNSTYQGEKYTQMSVEDEGLNKFSDEVVPNGKTPPASPVHKPRMTKSTTRPLTTAVLHSKEHENKPLVRQGSPVRTGSPERRLPPLQRVHNETQAPVQKRKKKRKGGGKDRPTSLDTIPRVAVEQSKRRSLPPPPVPQEVA